jgi:hypothetical protein
MCHRHRLLPVLPGLLVLAGSIGLRAQPRSSSSLPPDRFRNGEATLRAFAPISEATRQSVVKFNVNGKPCVGHGCERRGWCCY